MWVNVAFTSVFAPFTEIGPAEYKRVTEVEHLGYVYGTMAALKRMLPRHAGTIVQVGSALAYRGIPLQSAYCGAKHAIQGFNESLRCELLHDKSNVRVTMVQMPAVNTPQFDWVLSRLPKPAQPVAADLPAGGGGPRGRVRRRSSRRREYWVGGSTAATLAANAVAPGLLDRYLARTGFSWRSTPPAESSSHPVNLWKPADGPSGPHYTAHGSFDGQAKPRSVQLWASQHHGLLGGALLGLAGAAVAAAVGRRTVNAWLAGVRAGYGAVQLLRPAYSAEQLPGGPLDPGAVAAVRVLGARQLAQAAMSVTAPSARLPSLGPGRAGPDARSAWRSWPWPIAGGERRPAMVSRLIAAAFAAGGAAAARRAAAARSTRCDLLNGGTAIRPKTGRSQQPVHGIDRTVRNVQTGRFERGLSALTAADALVTRRRSTSSTTAPASATRSTSIAVVLGPVGAAAGVAGFFSRRMAKTALPRSVSPGLPTAWLQERRRGQARALRGPRRQAARRTPATQEDRSPPGRDGRRSARGGRRLDELLLVDSRPALDASLLGPAPQRLWDLPVSVDVAAPPRWPAFWREVLAPAFATVWIP